MKRLIYASTASTETQYETVLEILNISNRENKLHGITGILIFDGKFFMQCIEGDPGKIQQLMSNIFKDPRHHSVMVIGEETNDERFFPNWSMGYLNREKPIRDLLRRITRNESFSPSDLTMEEAKTILVELSFLL